MGPATEFKLTLLRLNILFTLLLFVTINFPQYVSFPLLLAAKEVHEEEILLLFFIL